MQHAAVSINSAFRYGLDGNEITLLDHIVKRKEVCTVGQVRIGAQKSGLATEIAPWMRHKS